MEEMGRSNEERQRDPRGWADVILMRPSSAWGHYACQDLVRNLTGVVCWGWCWGRCTGAGQTRRDKSTWHATVLLCPPSHNVEAVPAVVAVRTVAWCGCGGAVVAFQINGAQQNPQNGPVRGEDRRLALDGCCTPAPSLAYSSIQSTDRLPSVTARLRPQCILPMHDTGLDKVTGS